MITKLKHWHVANREEAFLVASNITLHDYEYDVARSERAGYPIYYSVYEGCNEWVSDLGNRLEVNHADGRTTNIWIEDELLQNLVKKAQEFGYTAG